MQPYEARTPGSAALHRRAVELFPSGLTHDSRRLTPYPLAVARAQGSRKWDVDGNEYVDYYGGHGAMLLGHAHPAVVEAVRDQVARGTQYGAAHELEVLWAERIRALMPAAQRVRFTASGTEASLLGLRLARAFTGRRRVLRFHGHFHGWHDQVAFGAGADDGRAPPPGVTPETFADTVLCRPNDVDQVRRHLEEADDIAAVLLEPTGGSFGRVPTPGPVLQQLRELTRAHGVLLLFDEVITGFRVAPGGAQAHYGVAPDLSFLAKVVAGGLPGGALAGRADIMDRLAFGGAAGQRVPHQGTFNANPLSASAGIATLDLVAAGQVTAQANAVAEALRQALQAEIDAAGLPWVVYGEFSAVHLLPDAPDGVTRQRIEAGGVDYRVLKGTPPETVQRLRRGLLAGGVDFAPWPGGLTSAVHTQQEVEVTAAAFRDLLRSWPGLP